ncbi:MAG: peptidylprolyl isomerase [Oscillospiraceae bacterium]|nr:peptidylprolyl isomerase [Oscillospiraceae bacterium]
MKLGRIILSAVLSLSCILGAAGCNNAPVSSVGNVETLNIVDGDKIAEISIEGYGTIKAKLFPDLAPKGVENFIKLAEQGYYDGLKIHRVLADTIIQGGSLYGDGTGGKALIDESGSFDLETSEKARHFYGALSYANDLGKNATQFFIVNSKEPQDISTLDTEQIKAAALANTDLKATATEGSSEYNTYAYKEKYYNSLATMVSGATEEVAAKYKENGGLPLFDGGYTVFGQVYEGFDVMEAISKAELQTSATGEKSKPVQDIVITSVKIVTFSTSTAETQTEEKDDEKPETAETGASTADTTDTTTSHSTETAENQ